MRKFEISVIFLIIVDFFASAADLECYLGRNPKGHLPYLSDVCHKFKFVKPPQCLKFTQGEIVTRDCDPSMLCERFNIRNRCVNSVKQASFLPNHLRLANLYGEICCCSTDLCNSSNRPFLHLLSTIFSTICSMFIGQLFFISRSL